MAKLFGYPINVEPEDKEEAGSGGVSSITGEASRSATQSHGEATSSSSGLPQSETNHPYTRFFESGSFPMESESDLDNCFIDFFGRESYEIETVGDGGFGEMEEDESVELGLGIGAGSGSGGNKESDSGRVEVVTDLSPFEGDLFCEEEAMLMADEVLEWENLQNDITWELDPVEEEEEEEEEDDIEEEEEEGEELALQSNANLFLENLESQDFSTVNDFYEESVEAAEDILMEAMEVTSFMDFDYGDLLHELNADFVDAFFHPHPFNQDQPPPPIMATRPASKRFVDDLPLVEITSEELSNGSVVCAICIGDLVVEEKVRRLPCRHYYHGECIVPWLGMKNTCPVCRYELPTDDDIVCVMNRSRM